MLRMSYCDHFSSIFRPSVNIFKRLLLWRRWANFANFIWSLLRVGEWKIAKMVAVGWPRWPPCPYMVRTFKNLILQNQGCWIFAQIIEDGRSTKIAKRIIVHWSLTFLQQGQVCFPMQLYEPHTFDRENCWEFQRTSPLKPLCQFCSNLIRSHLRVGKRQIAKIVAVSWPRWPPCPYMVKTFKNLLLQNWECLGAESLQKSSGMRGLWKLLKELSYVDIWPFYGKVKFASLCICMSPIHLNRKIVENFKGLLLWSHRAKFAQIPYWAFLGRGNERLLKWSRFIDQDCRHAHIW